MAQPKNTRCMMIGTDYSSGDGMYTDFNRYIALAIPIIVKTNKGEIPYELEKGGNIFQLLGQPVTDLPAVTNDMAIQLDDRLPDFLQLVRITPGVDSATPNTATISIVVKNLFTNKTYEVQF